MNGQKKNKYILQIPKQRCSGKEKDDKGGRKKKSETQLGINVNRRNKEIMSIERSRKQN